MSDQNQELEPQITNNNGDPENLQEECIDLALLRLDSFNSSSNSNSNGNGNGNNNNNNNHCHRTPCPSCGFSSFSNSTAAADTAVGSSNKRRSPNPIPSSTDQQDQLPKKPKKLFLEPHESTIAAAGIPSLSGFSKITLPLSSSPPTSQAYINHSTNSHPLRRCFSDPCDPPVSVPDSLYGSGTGSTTLIAQSPPESANKMGTDAATPLRGSASLPPRPPLRRSVSDPSPNKSFSRSSGSNEMGISENPNYKALRKMSDWVKEMNHLWDSIVFDEMTGKEDIEEEVKATEGNTCNAIKDDSMMNCEEAVSVEKTGELLTVCFKCPCGKGYQILVSKGTCYYRLV